MADTQTLKVPPVRVLFDAEDRRTILEQIDLVLASGMVAAGRYVRAFEECWAGVAGCREAVAVASGGSALQLAMKALGCQGREVLVPTNTFIATANAVQAAGGRPVLVDLDPETLSPGLEQLRAAAGERTAGVAIVHVGGIVSPEIEEIAAWCRGRGLWLLEDAAHAHGSEMNGRRAGSFGDAAAFSFFATKVMTSGEGGMVTTDRADLAESLRRLRDYGKKSAWESVHTEVEMNHRLTEIGALLGLSQAARLDDFIDQRQRVADFYRDRLPADLELVLPRGRSSWYKFIALLPEGLDRAAFKAAAGEAGVSLAGGVYELPLHRQPVFEGGLLASGEFPAAEDFCARHICLPIYPGMPEEHAEHVAETLAAVLDRMCVAS